MTMGLMRTACLPMDLGAGCRSPSWHDARCYAEAFCKTFQDRKNEGVTGTGQIFSARQEVSKYDAVCRCRWWAQCVHRAGRR
ncbi:Uncharacterised protein [Mycobacteroides abscessus subsp. abscessus]|nr:Uncharacterised protein [Mycobacteroides abscessus subsp. abscessus]